MLKLSACSPLIWTPGILLLASCASRVPVNIREAPPDSPSLAQVRADSTAHRGESVRWGGEILATENREATTWLTVLARPLASNGKPESTDDSSGRFLARVEEFLDPGVYKVDRKVTVRGTLGDPQTRQVGKFSYAYPVVNVSDWYLWPQEVDYPPGYYYPWRYDPFFYDPWYYDPWYRYPYYPRHHKDKTE